MAKKREKFCEANGHFRITKKEKSATTGTRSEGEVGRRINRASLRD
jgi:hypothetical protein